MSGYWHGLCMTFRYFCSVSLKPHPVSITIAVTKVSIHTCRRSTTFGDAVLAVIRSLSRGAGPRLPTDQSAGYSASVLSALTRHMLLVDVDDSVIAARTCDETPVGYAAEAVNLNEAPSSGIY